MWTLSAFKEHWLRTRKYIGCLLTESWVPLETCNKVYINWLFYTAMECGLECIALHVISNNEWTQWPCRTSSDPNGYECTHHPKLCCINLWMDLRKGYMQNINSIINVWQCTFKRILLTGVNLYCVTVINRIGPHHHLLVYLYWVAPLVKSIHKINVSHNVWGRKNSVISLNTHCTITPSHLILVYLHWTYGYTWLIVHRIQN